MIIDELITDRTQADVTRLLELRAIGYADMTAAEKAEYAASKGAYNYTDLNRVGNAMTYVKNLLDQIAADVADTYDDAVNVIVAYLHYDATYYDTSVLPNDLGVVLYVTPVDIEAVKTDWTQSMIAAKVTDAIHNAFSVLYIPNNLNKLRSCIPLTGAPSTPSMDNLTYRKANDIEKILQIIYDTAVQYREDKLNAIYAAEADAILRYTNTELNWIWSDEAFAGEF